MGHLRCRVRIVGRFPLVSFVRCARRFPAVSLRRLASASCIEWSRSSVARLIQPFVSCTIGSSNILIRRAV